MSQELIAAITDRVDHGYTKEAIVAELISAGYTTEQAEAAYVEALAAHSRGLIDYGDLLRQTWVLMKQEGYSCEPCS